MTDISENNIQEKKRSKRIIKKILHIFVIALAVIAGIVLIMAARVMVLQRQGKESLTAHEKMEHVEIVLPKDAVQEDSGNIVTYNGKKYRRNENIISILCMGIDTEMLGSDERLTGENGQADSLFIIILDTVTGGMKLISISRDTMVDVDLYNVDNEYVETSRMQICLAYAYGDGKESSCKNTMKSVSRLMYGMPMDAYVAIDLPAISVLNDAIGGVEVEVLEDLTKSDPALIKGEVVTLHGKQAEIYVRTRDYKNTEIGAESNNYRMSRQKQYLMAFIEKAMRATKKDLMLPVTLYQELSDYMVTDIELSEVVYLASLVLKDDFHAQDLMQIPGEARLGEVYAEYYVDETALYEMILDVYYIEET